LTAAAGADFGAPMRCRFLLPFHLAVQLLALAAVPSALAQTGPQTLSTWVEMTGGEAAELRAVVDGDACPSALVDGRAAPMAARTPRSDRFPLVCALRLPPGAAAVSVDGQPAPLPAREPRRIVIFGDTGCEVKDLSVQACNDPRAWPFAQVARLAAARRPDLVIHVGDYYYRESPCPLAIKACAGSPYGDRWQTWDAEFFAPAEPLLAAAPWVFARGNHESCERGWRGWYALLDSAPLVEGCPWVATPFAVKAGSLNLYVLDSAEAEDRGHKTIQVDAVRSQLDRFGEALDTGEGWIVTHRPVWGLAPVARLGPAAPLEVGLNFTEQAAFAGRAMPGVQMIASGHVHHFQSITFGPARPAQLVAGSGGGVEVKADLARPYGGRRGIDGLDARTFSFARFGYYLMERDGEDWVGTFRDLDDVERARCRLHLRQLDCRAV
jgi:hypothetical protein